MISHRRLYGAETWCTATLVSLVFLACGSGGGGGSTSGSSSASSDASAFVGTWQYTSQTGSYDCSPGGSGPITIDNPPQVITVSVNGTGIALHNGDCTLLFTVSGTSATLQPGSMCPSDTTESESLSISSDGRTLSATAQWETYDSSGDECSDSTQTEMERID